MSPSPVPNPDLIAFEHDVVGGTLGTVFAVTIIGSIVIVALLITLAIHWATTERD